MQRRWEMLQTELRLGRIGRREFIAAAAALGFSGTSAFAQTPKRGGNLIIGVTGGNTSTDSLDPSDLTNDFTSTIRGQLYDTLTVVDGRMKVHPSLAEGWETKPGATDWIFKLRRGVTFHNGKELTAADVVSSIVHHRGKPKSAAKPLIAQIDEIKAADKYTVTFTLKGGNADLPFLMSDFHLCIAPENSTFADGVGTGAFTLESFEPGIRGRTKRNPNDWNHERGFLDSIETVAINDPAARLSALLSGSVHLINDVIPSAVDQIKNKKELQVFIEPGTGYDCFPMLCDQAPFENADLRLAMKYAIDRNTMLKLVLRGYGKIGNDTPVAASDPFYAADIPQRPYDPDKAKFYYRKSGNATPLVLSVADVAFNGAVEAAQVFQQSAKKAGIDIQIKQVPSDGYYSHTWNHAPFSAIKWQGRPTADLIFSTVFESHSLNETHWQNPKFDSLLVAARAELDTAKRKQMYHDLQFIVHEEGGNIIPMFTSFIDASAAKVRGFVPTPVNTLGGYRGPEKIWFD